MKLSIIIVNYNVRYFLEQALLSVQQAIKNIDAEIFVVDNNSADDSVEMVKERFPSVQLIANADNPGFSAANNQAIRLAKGKYILLLNPDTVLEEDTLDKTLTFMEDHPNAGGLGVKMIDGAGNFLPESKRGLPTPFVAFSKAFGLSKLFPTSETFNRYHLGYLDKDKTHEIEILAGAFMLMPKKILDEVGLLDETFFMYGEDIDLSYRILKGGYQNYYFADTTIIHYKGESTKKGSLGYVRTFYKAMIIFSKKHFHGEQAFLLTTLLQVAIYFRALLTLLSNFFKKIYLPVLDAVVIFIGIYWLKDFWATSWFHDKNYYQPSFLYFNVPLYISVWLGSIYLKGGYDRPFNIARLFSGLTIGSLLLVAIYGLLPLEYRTSRMLLLLGAVWAVISTFTIRLLIHFKENKNFQLGKTPVKNLIIVGGESESKRVLDLLQKAAVQPNYIGAVTPSNNRSSTFLSTIHQLKEMVEIYQVDEIIFCSKDVSSQSIMQWMTRLGPRINYKIVPTESMSIIGSHSKNTPGELYTVAIQFQIASILQKRNKRLLDILVSLCLLLIGPFILFFIKEKTSFFINCFQVFFGKKTWVGYAATSSLTTDLPPLQAAVLSPLEGLDSNLLDATTIERLNFLYARDYDWRKDLSLIGKGWQYLGRIS